MTRALIVYPHDNMLTNPTMVGLMQELGRRGVAVSVMTPTKAVPDDLNFPSMSAPVTFLPLPPPPLGKPTGLRSAWRSLSAAWTASSLDKYDVILGADPLGAAIAARLNAERRKPLGYLSFELIFEHEVETEYERELKTNERAAARISDLILIQDEERRAAFCQENGVDPARCVLVPVSPVDAQPARTNYLRKHLGISPEKIIVLYQGSLYDWSCRNEFAEMVSYWSDRYCLVIHSRDKPGKRMTAFMHELSANAPIHFTSAPVSISELAILTASADVGLACYRTNFDHWLTGDNLKLLGLSSGKIAYYAMCQLPVLARSLPSIESNQAKYGFGRSYARLSESGAMLEQIMDDWDAMSKSARDFYSQRLNPIQPIENFCNRMLSFTNSRSR